MKRIPVLIKSLFTIALIGVTAILWAQTQQPAKSMLGTTYLNDKVSGNGPLSVAKFLELIEQPILVKDSRDNQFYQSNSFLITFGERGLYEDNEGKPIIVTDYISKRGYGQVDTSMYYDLRARAKPGDTAYIDHVTFRNDVLKDKFSQSSSSIKIILTK